MSYRWRKIGQDRWLCLTKDTKRTLVGGVIKHGTRRYRVQLRSLDGFLFSLPVVVERLHIAQQILKSKLHTAAP